MRIAFFALVLFSSSIGFAGDQDENKEQYQRLIEVDELDDIEEQIEPVMPRWRQWARKFCKGASITSCVGSGVTGVGFFIKSLINLASQNDCYEFVCEAPRQADLVTALPECFRIVSQYCSDSLCQNPSAPEYLIGPVECIGKYMSRHCAETSYSRCWANRWEDDWNVVQGTWSAFCALESFAPGIGLIAVSATGTCILCCYYGSNAGAPAPQAEPPTPECSINAGAAASTSAGIAPVHQQLQ